MECEWAYSAITTAWKLMATSSLRNMKNDTWKFFAGCKKLLITYYYSYKIKTLKCTQIKKQKHEYVKQSLQFFPFWDQHILKAWLLHLLQSKLFFFPLGTYRENSKNKQTNKSNSFNTRKKTHITYLHIKNTIGYQDLVYNIIKTVLWSYQKQSISTKYKQKCHPTT